MAKGGGHWDFWFCSFGYFLGQFMCKKPWFFDFGVHCGLRIYWFLVFMKNTNGFFGFDIQYHFRFFLFDLLYLVLVSPRSEQQLRTSTDLARCKCY